jgi:catechol 2,3-dioxygenase-like lactoylglutathione lyase family enzyme
MHHRLVLFLLMMAFPWLLRGALYLLARYGGVSLRPLVPVLAVVCGALWIAGVLYMVLDRPHLQNIFLTAYGGLVLVYSWVRGESLFETHLSNVGPRVPACLLEIPASTCVGVRNLESASSWYVEKLGLRKLAESPEGTIEFKFKAEDVPLILVPHDKFYPRTTPMLYTRKIQKAWHALSSRGVHAGVIERDRQGTHSFEVRDSEGNRLEVSEEPSGGFGGEVF